MTIAFLSWVDEFNKLACSQCMGLHNSAGRALQRKCKGRRFKSHWSPKKLLLWATLQLLKLRFNCDSRIFISFVFPQFTSLNILFHSSHGLMNSINWPAVSVWVFVAQVVEHCSAIAEATGSNPVEAP